MSRIHSVTIQIFFQLLLWSDSELLVLEMQRHEHRNKYINEWEILPLKQITFISNCWLHFKTFSLQIWCASCCESLITKSLTRSEEVKSAFIPTTQKWLFYELKRSTKYLYGWSFYIKSPFLPIAEPAILHPFVDSAITLKNLVHDWAK